MSALKEIAPCYYNMIDEMGGVENMQEGLVDLFWKSKKSLADRTKWNYLSAFYDLVLRSNLSEEEKEARCEMLKKGMRPYLGLDEFYAGESNLVKFIMDLYQNNDTSSIKDLYYVQGTISYALSFHLINVGESLEIRRGDFNLDRGTLTFKGNTYMLCDETVQLLRSHFSAGYDLCLRSQHDIRSSDHLFVSSYGKPLSSSGLGRVRSIVKKFVGDHTGRTLSPSIVESSGIFAQMYQAELRGENPIYVLLQHDRYALVPQKDREYARWKEACYGIQTEEPEK